MEARENKVWRKIETSTSYLREKGEQRKAVPVGQVYMQAGIAKGNSMQFVKFYTGFKLNGNDYRLGDTVMVTRQRSYVMAITHVKELSDSSVMVGGQRLYTPDELVNDSRFQTLSKVDLRESFYSFDDHDDFSEGPAESIQHKCPAFAIDHPGHRAPEAYNTSSKRLWDVADNNDEEFRHDAPLRRRAYRRSHVDNMGDVQSKEAGNSRRFSPARRQQKSSNREPRQIQEKCQQDSESETEEEARSLLQQCNALTDNDARNRCRGMLLRAVKHFCHVADSKEVKSRIARAPKPFAITEGRGSLKLKARAQNKVTTEALQQIGATPSESPDDGGVSWLGAVDAIVALESCSHQQLSPTCYSEKMRRLAFNLQNNAKLAGSVIFEALAPATLIGMSSGELKDGRPHAPKINVGEVDTKGLSGTDRFCGSCPGKMGLLSTRVQWKKTIYSLECLLCGSVSYTSVYPYDV